MMEASFEKLLVLLAEAKVEFIGWKSKSTREKDRIDAMALSRLQEDPKAFD